MLATKAPIEIIVNIKEKMNIQQFGQKAALAILRTGIILENFDLFVNIVNIAIANPNMNANPVMRVTMD